MALGFYTDEQLAQMAMYVESVKGPPASEFLQLDNYVRLMKWMSSRENRPEQERQETVLAWDYAVWCRCQSVRYYARHLPDFPCPIKPGDPTPRSAVQIDRDKQRAAWQEQLRQNPELGRLPKERVDLLELEYVEPPPPSEPKQP